MNREEAVSRLRRYRREAYRCNEKTLIFSDQSACFQICVYGRCLVDELIRRIRASADDPIQIITEMYLELDYTLGDSDDDHFETHKFASIMESECGKVLRYLKTIEKRRCEDAKN